jgi:hypothetical protein
MDQKEQRERESGRTISLVTFTSAWHVIQNWEYVVLEKLTYWVLNHFESFYQTFIYLIKMFFTWADCNLYKMLFTLADCHLVIN